MWNLQNFHVNKTKFEESKKLQEVCVILLTGKHIQPEVIIFCFVNNLQNYCRPKSEWCSHYEKNAVNWI
jgi:hypothetical protein